MFSLQQGREECRKAVEIIRNKVHSKPKKQILTTLTIMSKDNLGGKLPIRQQNTRARCPLVRCSKASTSHQQTTKKTISMVNGKTGFGQIFELGPQINARIIEHVPVYCMPRHISTKYPAPTIPAASFAATLKCT